METLKFRSFDECTSYSEKEKFSNEVNYWQKYTTSRDSLNIFT